jgi:hypothetical protein
MVSDRMLIFTVHHDTGIPVDCPELRILGDQARLGGPGGYICVDCRPQAVQILGHTAFIKRIASESSRLQQSPPGRGPRKTVVC